MVRDFRVLECHVRYQLIKNSCGIGVIMAARGTIEALLGVIGIRDIWVKNYRDTGYLGGKLKGYGIFLKRFWDIEDRSYHFLKESNKFISQYRRRK